MKITGTISKLDRKKLFKKLESISPKKRGNVIVKAMKQSARLLENHLKTRALKGQILKRRTGHLARSIQHKVINGAINLIAEIGSGVRGKKRLPYANIHETGGVITPKKGAWLLIPIRKGSTEAISMGLSKAGKPIAYSSKILSFRKVKKVTIPARKYLSKTLANAKRNIDAIFEAEIKRGLSK